MSPGDGQGFDDARRLKALADYRVLDTPAEDAFDNITQVAAEALNAPIALISLIDEQRQWFKSRIGLDAPETPREYAFCDHAIRQHGTFTVEDAARDPRFADNPLVTGDPKIRFYCGAVVRTPEGDPLGTLCVIDRVPRQATEADQALLEGLARQVESELEVRRRLLLLEEALAVQQKEQRSKELLASMLVHDLRAPLTSILLLAEMMAPADAQARNDIDDLKREVDRARRMLSDVLDICLNDLGGMRLRRLEVVVGPLLEQVAVRLARHGRVRGQDVRLELPPGPLVAYLDPEIITRVLENLIGNAIRHGPQRQPITLAARSIDGDRIRFEVRDRGEALTAEVRDSLFQLPDGQNWVPGRSTQRSHGLGLAFCLMAVTAHGGDIGVAPGPDGGNVFHVELPAQRPR